MIASRRSLSMPARPFTARWNGIATLLLTFCGLAEVASGQTVAWTARKNGTMVDGDARPGSGIPDWGKRALAVNGSGNVYLTGYSSNGSNYDYLTVAYDSAGTELWAKVKNGAANSQDNALALAVDGSGNVYVTGQSHNGSNYDYLTVAYDSAGTELWSKLKNGAADNLDLATALAVDGSGNVFVTGLSRNGTNYDYLTVAYDSAGTELWSKVKNGAANNEDYVYALAVDGSGNVYVTGYSLNGSNWDYLTVAYDSAGTELWAKVKNGAANYHDFAYALATDGSGNVYVTGYSYNGSNNDYLTVAYDSAGTELWSKLKNGTTNNQDYAYALAVDGSGNVYVTGESYNGSNNDYLTVAYDSAGTELWAKVKNGAANNQDYAYALAVDGSGGVYVTGKSHNGANTDYLTVAYDSAGMELWSKVKNGAANNTDQAYSLAVDGSGNVYVTGYSYNGSNDDYLTVAYDSAGTELWAAKEPPQSGHDDRPGAGDSILGKRALAVDGSGVVYVTGRSFNGSNYDYLTVAYDSAGAELWAKVKNGAANNQDHAHALALDGSGSVYVTGYSNNGSNSDYLTVAYDSAGTELWAKVKNGVGNSSDQAYAVALDGSGNVYVTGISYNGSNYDYLTVAYDNAGTELWAKVKNGAANNEDHAYAVAVDGSGNVYVTGISLGGSNWDYLTVAYDSAGTELWSKVKNGASNNLDQGYAIAVDGSGNVYVTGTSNNGSSYDYLTVAYDSAGTELWAKVKNGVGNSSDQAYAVAVDGSGNVYVTGISYNGSNQDYLTVAYDASGTELWAKVKNGAANNHDQAHAVAVDGSGNVYVTGSSSNGTNNDYLTVAYDSAGAELWQYTYDGGGGDSSYISVVSGNGLYVSGYSSGQQDDFFTIKFLIANDTTAPSDPAIGSTSPPDSVWSSDNTVEVSWSGAADEVDGSGLAGYSIEWNTTPVSTPDTVVDVVHGADPHSTTSSPLADGDEHYFHLSTCDNAGNCTATVHAGPFWIDTVAPGAPGALSSSSHDPVSTPVSDTTIEIAWGAAIDGTSGVASYGYAFDGSPTGSCLGSSTATASATSAALADGSWYVHVCAVDLAGNTGAAVHGGPWTVDTTSPVGLAVSSSSHTVATWSNDNTVDFGFSGATDGSGVAGYAVVYDQATGTEPTCAATQAASTFTGSSSPDADNWWIHVRAIDNAGNCGATVHLGPFQIDTQDPSAPTGLDSSSHDVGVASNDDTVEVEWQAAIDQAGLSGIDAYGFFFSTGEDDDCDDVPDVEEDVLSATSAALADGEHHFHLCAVDNAGNWSPVASIGPFVIDTAGAAVVAIGTVADTGDGELAEGEATAVGVTQLIVEFDGAMFDGSGDTDPADVTNPSNYHLYQAGPDGMVQTVGCGSPVGDDVEVVFAAASYSASTATAALSLSSSLALPRESYRLLVCPTLEDDAGTTIAGFTRNFTIAATDQLANPNFDHDLAGWVVTEPSPGSLLWSSSDLSSAPTSGSAEIVTASGASAVWTLSQCFAVSTNPVEASGWTEIESSIAGAPLVGARIDFFNGAGCSGAVVGSTLSPPVAGDTAGLRTYLRVTRSSPPAAALSVLVSMEVEGGAAAVFTARLDDLFYGDSPSLFADGFESSDTSAWSFTIP